MTAGWVYVIGIKGTQNRYKVGYSVDPDRRRGDLQTGQFETLTMTRKWATSNMERDEKAMHAALARYRTVGEWFECDLATIETAWAELRPPDPTFGLHDRYRSGPTPVLVTAAPYVILVAAVGYLIALIVWRVL